MALHPIDVPYAVDASGNLIKACRYVDNGSSSSVFVPFRSMDEWNAFVNNYPSSIVSLAFCSRPRTFEIAPDDQCPSPDPTKVDYDLSYARTGTTKNYTAVFECGSGILEIVKSYFLAGVSPDTATPDSGWERSDVIYIPGGCGDASGVKTGTKPASGLCTGEGVSASSVAEGTDTWTWSCSASGENGDVTVSCEAPKGCASCETAVCGSAALGVFPTEPKTNLCLVGDPVGMTYISDALNHSYIWSWQCTEGTSTVTCNAARKSCATCGSAALATVASSTAPTENLCGDGPVIKGPLESKYKENLVWAWTCENQDGSDTQNCMAPRE